MARVGIVFGLLLCGVTFAGLVGTAAKIPTQFVPMMFGIPVLFCGVVALNPHRRKVAMQVACGIATLGGVGGTLWSIGRLVRLAGGQDVDRYALTVIGVMSLCCVILAIACFRWFAGLRKKGSGEALPVNPKVNLHRSLVDEPVSHDVTTRESA